MRVGNGCGPAWMPKVIKKVLFNWFFEASCNKHDHGYEQGGNEVRRFECDWKFWLAMRRDVKRVAWYLRPVATLGSVSFYLMVRAFGWLQFNYEGRGPWSVVITQKLKNCFAIWKKN